MAAAGLLGPDLVFVLISPSVLTEAPVQAGGPAQTGDAVLLSTT